MNAHLRQIDAFPSKTPLKRTTWTSFKLTGSHLRMHLPPAPDILCYKLAGKVKTLAKAGSLQPGTHSLLEQIISPNSGSPTACTYAAPTKLDTSKAFLCIWWSKNCRWSSTNGSMLWTNSIAWACLDLWGGQTVSTSGFAQSRLSLFL
jgi:hypothetical protein